MRSTEITWQKKLSVTSLILLGLLLAVGIYISGRDIPRTEDLIPFSLSGYKRLLVLAPHCDDETLGTGGLILAAKRTGMEVKVAIATNGDGYIFATMEDFHRLYPRPSDFIRMGNLRQQESLSALQTLGVNADQVIFLSYPDRGTPSLWNNYWSRSRPYHSPYNGSNSSPYPITYHPSSVFAGEDLLADLRSILKSYRPDLVVYPHSDDVHPDHWGLSIFTTLALALEQHEDPSFRPQAFEYLVHRPDFPVPKGLKPEESLLPPPPLFELSNDWYGLALPTEDIALKASAVARYRSQLPLLRTLLESFVRRNELFAPSYTDILPAISSGNWLDPNTWMDMQGMAIAPLQKDPVRDFITRRLVPGADLMATYLARDQDNALTLCAQVRGKADPALIYTLHLKVVDSKGVFQYIAQNQSLSRGMHRAKLSGGYVCARFSPPDLEQAWEVLAGVDVRATGVGILDQVAWQVARVEPLSGSDR